MAQPAEDSCHAERNQNLHVVAEFDVGTNGRLLLVPVRVAGEECTFVVDTGASLTLLDQSLSGKLASAIGAARLATATGIAPAQLFECPDLAIGSLAVQSPGLVACCELQSIRRATGLPIQGVLGMDFLRSQIIQIDFDAGKLRFLDDGQELGGCGEAHALQFGADRRPYLYCGLPSVRGEWFLLDTGATGKTLQAAVFDRLAEQEELVLGMPSTAATVSGEITDATGKLSCIRTGSFSHEGIIVARDARLSSLGLDYLRRYLLTLDFPRQTAYLSAGKRHESPDDSHVIGFTLASEEGRVQVKSVSPDGSAVAAGVKVGDIILRAGGKQMQGKDLFDVREALAAEDQRPIQISLSRRGRILDVVVTPQDRFAVKEEGALRPGTFRWNAPRQAPRSSAVPIWLR